MLNNFIVSGLNLAHTNSTSEFEGDSIFLTSVIVNPGKIIVLDQINDENSIWNSKSEYKITESYSITVGSNTTNNSLYSIYCYPNMLQQYSENIYSLSFEVIKGVPGTSPALPTQSEDYIFLGTIFVPYPFPDTDKRLYIRSLNVSSSSLNYSKTQTDWYNEVIREIEEWKPHKFYFENQIARYLNSLYKCKLTHASFSTFSEHQDTYWERISGNGEGGGCDCYVEYEVDGFIETNIIVPNQGNFEEVIIYSSIIA